MIGLQAQIEDELAETEHDKSRRAVQLWAAQTTRRRPQERISTSRFIMLFCFFRQDVMGS
jgi:hypothetical protein